MCIAFASEYHVVRRRRIGDKIIFWCVFFFFHFHSFEMKMHKLNKNNNTHIIINAQARANACRFICFLLFSNDLLSSSCITWNALLSSFDAEYRRICALIQKICLFAPFFFLFNCISIVFFSHSFSSKIFNRQMNFEQNTLIGNTGNVIMDCL